MGCYCHLTRDDREEIAVLRAEGHSMRSVAAAPEAMIVIDRRRIVK